MMFNSSSLPIQFVPIQESELGRMNELSNMPEIAEHFETISPVPMETTLALWQYIQNGIVSLWGIHTGDRIIGGAGYYAQPPGTRLSHSATFFLFIEPEFWGKGIGTNTVRFLENEVRKKGYRRMECMVADTNPRAIRLYEQLGFELEGKKREAFFIDGRYVDLLMLGKVLFQE